MALETRRTGTREWLQGTLLTVASVTYLSPIENDAAIIRLAQPAKGVARSAILLSDSDPPRVGGPVWLSGFPLNVPTVVTHQGFGSGLSKDGRVIVLQAPIEGTRAAWC